MIYLMYLRSVRTVMVSVTTFRRCPNCSQGVLFSQTPKYDDVACEVDVGRHRVDIALFRNGKPTYGIEVQDTHPVDDEKWDAFAELQFPCIEVDSRDVIRMWEYDLKSWRQQLFLNISLFVEVNEIATWRQASTLVFAICVGCVTKHNPICTLNHNFNITQHGRGGIDRMDYLTFIILHKKYDCLGPRRLHHEYVSFPGLLEYKINHIVHILNYIDIFYILQYSALKNLSRYGLWSYRKGTGV